MEQNNSTRPTPALLVSPRFLLRLHQTTAHTRGRSQPHGRAAQGEGSRVEVKGSHTKKEKKGRGPRKHTHCIAFHSFNQPNHPIHSSKPIHSSIHPSKPSIKPNHPTKIHQSIHQSINQSTHSFTYTTHTTSRSIRQERKACLGTYLTRPIM